MSPADSALRKNYEIAMLKNKEKKQRDEQKKNQEAKIADANVRAGSESQY